MNNNDFAKIGMAAVLGVTLTACQTTGSNHTARVQAQNTSSFCEERPEVCLLVGALVVGGVVAVAANSGSSPSAPPPIVVPPAGQAPVFASDVRLKRDIVPVEMLSNGIQTYAFRYVGDEQVFVGVMAQDLLENPRFSSAVIQRADGYLAVDYDALGLKIVDSEAMAAASAALLDRL